MQNGRSGLKSIIDGLIFSGNELNKLRIHAWNKIARSRVKLFWRMACFVVKYELTGFTAYPARIINMLSDNGPYRLSFVKKLKFTVVKHTFV